MSIGRPLSLVPMIACFAVAFVSLGGGDACLMAKAPHWLSPIPPRLCCPGTTCADDYLGKATACVARKCDYVCDDYCRRSGIAPSRACNVVCDDYCRRPAPIVTCPQAKQLQRPRPHDVP
jgi:hypothetical protein